jgi:hypothetical protein
MRNVSCILLRGKMLSARRIPQMRKMLGWRDLALWKS